MGDEYNHLGEVCESIKGDKGEEICMGSHNSFTHSVFAACAISREKERDIGAR
jgi:hypothetical protein